MAKYKVVVLGDGGVGKSSITIQFVKNYFVTEYNPTIEGSYQKQVAVDDESCLLEIFDTAGQDDYKVLVDSTVRVGQGFLCVYSVASRPSFEMIPMLREKILRVKESNYPTIIVGNKCDLQNERVVSTKEGEDLAASLECPFFETSAKSKINTNEVFHELVRLIKKYNVPMDDTPQPVSGRKKDRKCCII